MLASIAGTFGDRLAVGCDARVKSLHGIGWFLQANLRATQKPRGLDRVGIFSRNARCESRRGLRILLGLEPALAASQQRRLHRRSPLETVSERTQKALPPAEVLS